MQHAHRRLLLDHEVLDRFQLGNGLGRDRILAEHHRHVLLVLSFRRQLDLLKTRLFLTPTRHFRQASSAAGPAPRSPSCWR